jgi:ring-1,2-phenylacetyl-CoA epoxidase subunit PaaC
MSTDPRLNLLLALADDELILGHRISEWTGWVPYVEEDLALSSIAQDEIAHARVLYGIASTLDGRDPDALALGRQPGEYRNAILCERPNRDFAYTIARHWLYDTADDVRLAALEATAFKELREAVAVLRLEERYHLEHANAWFARLAHGPVDARHRFADALGGAFGEALALFEPVEREAELVSDGALPRPNDALREDWIARVREALEEAGLEQVLGAQVEEVPGEIVPTSTGEIAPGAPAGLRRPDATSGGAGGRRGHHSEDFRPLWEEMTALYRAHPGARW